MVLIIMVLCHRQMFVGFFTNIGASYIRTKSAYRLKIISLCDAKLSRFATTLSAAESVRVSTWLKLNMLMNLYTRTLQSYVNGDRYVLRSVSCLDALWLNWKIIAEWKRSAWFFVRRWYSTLVFCLSQGYSKQPQRFLKQTECHFWIVAQTKYRIFPFSAPRIYERLLWSSSLRQYCFIQLGLPVRHDHKKIDILHNPK